MFPSQDDPFLPVVLRRFFIVLRVCVVERAVVQSQRHPGAVIRVVEPLNSGMLP